MAEWATQTLEGRIVRLEPLRTEHEEGLWLASRDPRTWRWLSVAQPQSREEWHAFVGQALAAAAAGTEIPLVTIRDEAVVGSTRFLALRPEHLSVEIGWTWLHPSAWSTGANVEAKLLQLRHAFETWGCRRVEPGPADLDRPVLRTEREETGRADDLVASDRDER